jgi:hypothetical protein
MQSKKMLLLLGVIILFVMQPMWSKSELNPAVAPGGNFDLTNWTLYLPGQTPDAVSTVSATELAGAKGFTDERFYTNSLDGAMILLLPQPEDTPVPVSGRTEFREVTDGWLAYGRHSLEAEVQIPQLAEQVIIAGIWQSWPQQEPLCELCYKGDGSLQLQMYTGNPTDAPVLIPAGKVSVGKHFSYTLFLSENEVTVNVDGHNTDARIPQAFAGRRYYFRAGNAVPPAAEGTAVNPRGTMVKFYRFSLQHE